MSKGLAGLVRPGRLIVLALWIVALLIPFFFEAFWLQTGLFAMAAVIGAIGLNILTGTTGQLSLAHAFFAAVGAYGYCYFAGGDGIGVSSASGLGLPVRDLSENACIREGYALQTSRKPGIPDNEI